MLSHKTGYALIAVAAAAVGLTVGIVLYGGESKPAWPEGWPKIPVQAATAQGYENFAVATGPVQDGVEGFYFLDFLTGDLRAVAINTRTGDFGSFFQYNLTRDFAAAGSVKNPKYLMVTGLADIPRGRGNTQLAKSIVYVTEATTGHMAAYVMPWNTSLQASGKMQSGTFLKIADVQLRSAFVRDQ